MKSRSLGTAWLQLPLADEAQGLAIVAVDVRALQRGLFLGQRASCALCGFGGAGVGTFGRARRLLERRFLIARRRRRLGAGARRRACSSAARRASRSLSRCVTSLDAARTAATAPAFAHLAAQNLEAAPQPFDGDLLIGEQGARLALVLLDLQEVGACRAAGNGAQAHQQRGAAPPPSSWRRGYSPRTTKCARRFFCQHSSVCSWQSGSSSP